MFIKTATLMLEYFNLTLNHYIYFKGDFSMFNIPGVLKRTNVYGNMTNSKRIRLFPLSYLKGDTI